MDELVKLKECSAYKVNRYGDVYSFKKDKPYLMKQVKHHTGYWTVNIRDDKNIVRRLSVHRLVANAFLEPPTYNYKYVTHLDGNSDNNHVSNLAWAISPRYTKSKSVERGEFISYYDGAIRVHQTLADAARTFNMLGSRVSEVLDGQRKSYNGVLFISMDNLNEKHLTEICTFRGKLDVDRLEKVKTLLKSLNLNDTLV